MENFSVRIKHMQRSFIREILKVANDPSIISFAGGLPNKDLFPVKELKQAANDVLSDDNGKEVLQYSNTEGYRPLRKYIADRYKKKKGIIIPVENILITSGSQQGLDLLGKIFLDEKDKVIIEKPGYLGAIQAFSIFGPEFRTVTLSEEGLELNELEEHLRDGAKFIYTVPNFQNPTGITYKTSRRRKIAELIKKYNIYLIEDDPYGDLRYSGQEEDSFKRYVPDKTILLGSFSKTIAPGFRIGWIVVPDNVLDKLIIAKQASDLHTNYVGQQILNRYLECFELDSHIEKIKTKYREQSSVMIDSIERYFPDDVSYTRPDGGMFLWVRLPEGFSALELFDIALEKNVAFVPGDPFYINKRHTNAFRLNFSCVDGDLIELGIEKLAEAIKEQLNRRNLKSAE